MTASLPALLDGVGTTGVGSGVALDRTTSAPHVVNETRRGIVRVMRALGRPTTPEELRAIWGKRKPLGVFDYHLSTLVRAGVAELLIDGPQLRFRLADGAAFRPTSSHVYRERCR
jgi:hypothetical protein